MMGKISWLSYPSPSGVGKTTLTKNSTKISLIQNFVSHTTRPPKSNEVNGVDYHFVSMEKFKELIKNKKNFEYAEIFENYYGTLKDNVDQTIIDNDIMAHIDWQELNNYQNLKI